MGASTVKSCPFCDVILDDAIVVSTPDSGIVRFEPLNPVAPGHMLFVPIEHVEYSDPSSSYPAAVVGDAMTQAAVYAQKLGRPYNLITSCGSVATQTVRHIHIHYVPRRLNDGLPLPWTGQEKRS